jgi:hypothetical protein
MQKKMLFATLLLGTLIMAFSACENDNAGGSDPDPQPSNEYVAKDSDFDNFRTWTVVSKLDKALNDDGRAHSNGARTIWIKQADAKRGSNGQYPVGTILVKEVKDYGVVGMVKRGGSFNSGHQGWEWFQLSSGGKIDSRNASNLCNGCHAKVKDMDYVFTKN